MPRIIKSAKGTFNSATVTVDSSGRVIAGESGSGGAVMTPKLYATGPASGTYNSNGNQIVAYAASGGGGGGGTSRGPGNPNADNPSGRAGAGGFGVVGIFTSDITPPFSQPYAVGGPGTNGSNSTGNSATDGAAGGTSSIANLFSLNGGNGGNRTNVTQGANPGNPGTIGSGTFIAQVTTLNASNQRAGGSSPTSDLAVGQIGNPNDISTQREGFMFSANVFGTGGIGAHQFPGSTTQVGPQSGKKGALLVFDNGS